MLDNLGSNTIRNVRNRFGGFSCVAQPAQKGKENVAETRWVLPKHFPVLKMKRYRLEMKSSWLRLRKEQKS